MSDALSQAERATLAVARHGRLALTDEQFAAIERIIAARETEAAARAWDEAHDKFCDYADLERKINMGNGNPYRAALAPITHIQEG